MGSFRVAGASEYLAITGWGVDDVKLAKKAWVWLGQRCTTLDAAPASYELVAQGVTSESFPVVLRVVYTVGPKIDDKKLGEEPLLLYAKLVAPPSRRRRSSSKEEGCSSRVKELVQGALERHVGALAAGMAAEQILGGGASSWFAAEVLDRVQLDLGKFGLCVYGATVKRLAVDVPTKKARIVAAADQAGFSVQVDLGAVSWSSKVEVNFRGNPGREAKKAGSCDDKQIKAVAGVGVEAHMEAEEGKNVPLRLADKLKQEQFIARASVQASDTTAEAFIHGWRKAEAEYLVTKMKTFAGNLRARKDKVTKTNAMTQRLQALSDFLDKRIQALEEDFQAIEERLRADDTQVKALEARKHLLDQLRAKADYAAADLQALGGMIRGFEATANMLRLIENIPRTGSCCAAAANNTQDSSKVDVRPLTDNVAMDID